MITFSMDSYKDIKSSQNFKSNDQREYADLECEICEYMTMEVIETNINSVGQLITKLKCPECGHIEVICEVGSGERINRKEKEC